MTTGGSSDADDLACIELVGSATAYLEGALDESEARRIDRHLEVCEGCRAAIEQLRTVIRIAGRLTAADVASIDPVIRDRLVTMFRKPRRL